MKEMLPTNLKYAGHLIGLILICACCSNPQDNHRDTQDVRTIILTSERNDNPALLNSFFAYKHHIALETNDSCLLRIYPRFNATRETSTCRTDSRARFMPSAKRANSNVPMTTTETALENTST